MAGHTRPQRSCWGWHRLDSSWASRLVAAAGVRPGELVVDVGAGSGVITEALLRAGAHVVAVELHPSRAEALRIRFVDRPVRVVQADFCRWRLPGRPFRVVANPPFVSLKGQLRSLLCAGSRLESAHLIVPRHVAREWCSGSAPGHGRWGAHFLIERDFSVPRWAFHPAPPHDAVVLVVRRR